jgi:hypothetical protein
LGITATSGHSADGYLTQYDLKNGSNMKTTPVTKATLGFAFTAVLLCGLMTGRGSAQTLVSPTSYSASSQYNNSTFAVGGLFDGHPPSGNLEEQWAANGQTDGDTSPIVKMDFGSTLTFSGLGYAERDTDSLVDQVKTINLFFMTQVEYNAYTLTPNQLNAAPTSSNYTTEESVAVTPAVSSTPTWATYTFSGNADVSGEYVVAQFVQDLPGSQAANPGGLEFRMVELAPEPSTWALMLGGVGLLAFWRIRARV